MLKLSVSEQQGEDLKVLSALGSETLSTILRDLNGIDSAAISPNAFRSLVRKHLRSDHTRILIRQLYSLTELLRKKERTVAEIVRALSDGIDRLKWNEEENNRWNSVAPIVEELIDHRLVRAVAKSLDLAYDYDNVLASSEILTDLRPIFDSAHSEILGTLVTQTMRLRLYNQTNERQIVSMALDEQDIRQIITACEEALKKADCAKKLMQEKCSVDAFIVGEKFYE